MKHIDFVFVGSAKDRSCQELEKKYHQKISHYAASEIVIVKDDKATNPQDRQNAETRALLTKIKSGDVVVVCDERGTNPDSKKFAASLEKWRMNGKRVVFVIGGAFGFSAELRERANFVLQLSDFTLPHELARVVLLEQTYRALTILAGEKYHHE